MKFLILFAAAATLGSGATLAADDSTSSPTPTVTGRGACKVDIQKFCAGVEHGNGKIRECLTEHSADLSDGCRQRVAERTSKTN